MRIDSITKSVAEAISKVVDESLKGKQHKIDANKNKKIDAHDFELLRAKKEVKEESGIDEANAPSVKVPVKGGMRVYGGAPGGSAKAYKDQHADPFSTTRGPSDAELKDVESEKKKVKKEEIDYKSRLMSMVAENHAFEQELNEVLSKNADASAWIHDFVHSDNPKFAGKSVKKRQKMALAAYYAKQRNEEVELQEAYEEIKVHSKDGKHIGTITHGKYQSVAYAHPTTKFGGSKEPHPDEDSMEIKGAHDTQKGIDFIHAHHRMMSEGVVDKVKGIFKKKEKSSNLFDQPHVKKDTKDYLKKSAKQPEGPNTVKNVFAKEGKDPAMDAGAGSEPPFAPPYNTSSSPAIKDKSGAVHTPMSRAKHLARTAMKKITKDLNNK